LYNHIIYLAKIRFVGIPRRVVATSPKKQILVIH